MYTYVFMLFVYPELVLIGSIVLWEVMQCVINSLTLVFLHLCHLWQKEMNVNRPEIHERVTLPVWHNVV